MSLSWDEHTMRILQPLNLKETAGLRKGKIPFILSTIIISASFRRGLRRGGAVEGVRAKDPDRLILDGMLTYITILPLRSPAPFSFMPTVPNGVSSRQWREKYTQTINPFGHFSESIQFCGLSNFMINEIDSFSFT